MKKLLLTFFLAIFCIGADSQNAVEDYSRLSKLSSDRLMREGREFFKQRKGQEALSRFLIVSGRYQTDESEEARKQSVRALNNAACVYKFLFYDYIQAYEYFNKAKDLCEETGFEEFSPVITVNMADLLNDYGLTFNSQKFLDDADNLFRECFDKAVENRDWELLTTSFFNLSNLKYDVSLADYADIFRKDIPADTPDLDYVRLQYRGIQRLQEGDYENARLYFMKQLQAINTSWEASRDTITAYINISETYKRQKNYSDAVKFLKKALEIADRTSTIDYASTITDELEDVFALMGDTAKSDQYHNLNLLHKEKIFNGRLSNIGEMKYVADLQKEEAKALKISERNRYLHFMIIALGIIMVIILFTAFLIWRHYRILKVKNRSLFDKYRQLMEAEEENRKEIKYTRSNLDHSRKESLINHIGRIMADSDIVCSENFSAKQLAQLVDSNTTYVSQVINETYGYSFSTLLGNARVKIACHNINESDKYDNLTIEGIARSVGFKSRTAFINAFKREVGLTPSQYIRMSKEGSGK